MPVLQVLIFIIIWLSDLARSKVEFVQAIAGQRQTSRRIDMQRIVITR